MRVLFFYALLTLCFAYAWFRGGAPERAAATIIAIGSILTTLSYTPYATRFQSVETGPFVIDIVVWFAFVALALKAERFWPIWVAALQGVAVAVHAIRLIDPTIIPWAYAFLMAIWVYPMLALLVFGIRQHQRRLKLSGADPSWSIFSSR